MSKPRELVPLPNIPNPAIQPFFPIEFNAIRKALVNLIQGITGIPCIVEERKGQTTVKTPRPPLPYCSFKVTTPAGKIGTDAFQNILGTEEAPSDVWNYGGVRKMVVSFKAYAQIPEEAYNYMALLEAAFDTDPVQSTLSASSIAFWESMGVVDISALLTAGYEGRASLDVAFGIPSSLNVSMGSIDSVAVSGEISFGSESEEVNFNVTGAPKL